MTGIPMILAFLVAIVIMIVAISKFKIHPFLSIMAVSLLLGLVAGILAVALCGSLGKDYEKIYDCGIQSLLTTVDGCIPLSEAMERAEELYYRGAVRLFRFFL